MDTNFYILFILYCITFNTYVHTWGLTLQLKMVHLAIKDGPNQF